MITGNDFIQLSNRWSMLPDDGGGGEAVWRTSICRAYYGAFHLARQLLTAIGIKVPKHNAHDFVRMALQQSGDGDLVKAGSMLADLRDARTDADYELMVDAHGKQKLAQECHHNAKIIIALLDSGGRRDWNPMRATIIAWMVLKGHRNT